MTTAKITSLSDFHEQALNNTQYIHTTIHNGVGRITLDRPQALNALHPYMMCQLRYTLAKWAENNQVQCVIVDSTSERAFSAGGDLKCVYQGIRNKEFDLLQFLFQEEYKLDALVYAYPKPYIAFINGIVMGGGMGISRNGRYRIVGPTVTTAMPETKIGFFPDAGATHFLNQCPGNIGLYLGLTGNSCDFDDSLTAGFVTHSIPLENQSTVQSMLIEHISPSDQNADQTIETLLSDYKIHTHKSERGNLYQNREAIEDCFAQTSLIKILERLDALTNEKQHPFYSFAVETLATLEQRSPTSLVITFEQLKQGQTLSFTSAMELEYKLSQNIIHQPDFPEGMRSVIIDKDLSPRWSISHWRDLTPDLCDAIIKTHFKPLDHTLFSL